jgi:uncharacterized coiled-coil protein SlyX
MNMSSITSLCQIITNQENEIARLREQLATCLDLLKVFNLQPKPPQPPPPPPPPERDEPCVDGFRFPSLDDIPEPPPCSPVVSSCVVVAKRKREKSTDAENEIARQALERALKNKICDCGYSLDKLKHDWSLNEYKKHTKRSERHKRWATLQSGAQDKQETVDQTEHYQDKA